MIAVDFPRPPHLTLQTTSEILAVALQGRVDPLTVVVREWIGQVRILGAEDPRAAQRVFQSAHPDADVGAEQVIEQLIAALLPDAGRFRVAARQALTALAISPPVRIAVPSRQPS